VYSVLKTTLECEYGLVDQLKITGVFLNQELSDLFTKLIEESGRNEKMIKLFCELKTRTKQEVVLMALRNTDQNHLATCITLGET